MVKPKRWPQGSTGFNHRSLTPREPFTRDSINWGWAVQFDAASNADERARLPLTHPYLVLKRFIRSTLPQSHVLPQMR